MLPPEMAMTWYVPASCRSRSIAIVEPGAIANQDRGDDRCRRGIPGPDARAVSCRIRWRAEAACSSSHDPSTGAPSTSAALLTDPTRTVPRRASDSGRSGTPGSRYRAGSRTTACTRTADRPATAARARTARPPRTVSITPPLTETRASRASAVRRRAPGRRPAAARSRPAEAVRRGSRLVREAGS